MPDLELRSWLQLFGRWLSQAATKPSKPLMVYERRSGEKELETKLSLLPDADLRFPRRPGAVSTWLLVDRREPKIGVFITLDNLLALAAANPQIEIKKSLQRSQGLTHRVQVSWAISSPGRFSFIVIDCLDIDLANQYIDEAPREIIRLTALEAFNMRPVEGLPWRDRIYHFPWLDTIQYLAPKKGCPEHPRYRRLCKRIQKVTFS